MVTRAERGNIHLTCVSATSESPCEPCGRPPLARCAGFGAVRVAVRRCRLREHKLK
eukprot:COSAG06_NODE_44981_length_358_cov_1.590734_1_plen_55_part_01